MPLSYSSPSSSSEASLDPYCYADADFGVHKTCFCGKRIELEVRTVDNITKTYKKCPMSGKDEDHTRYHINNWWDIAVSEQFDRIDRRFDEQKEMIRGAMRFGGDTNHEAIEEMRLQIEELKERLDKKDGEIARLMALIAKK